MAKAIVKTTTGELIDVRKPHTYLVRNMSRGDELYRLETTDIAAAKTAYRRYYSILGNNESDASIRVDGKELTYESERILMGLAVEICPDGTPSSRSLNPRAKNGPFVKIKANKANTRAYAISLSKQASLEFLGYGYATIKVDKSRNVINVLRATTGHKLCNYGSGKWVTAPEIKSAGLVAGATYPVEPCEGGITFRF